MPNAQRGVQTGDLVVRLAEPDDVEPVLDLLAEAGHWVRAVTGISQWPKRFPREFMIELVDRGVLYVTHDGRVLAATLCLQYGTTPRSGRARMTTLCTSIDWR